MPLYFVDTWFFIAYLHKYDSDHEAALRLGRSLRDAKFVTHDGVLLELLTFFAGHGPFWREQVAAYAREVISGHRFQTKALSRELFEQALALYERRLDKEYSLVDCMSMTLMRRRDITGILTNDHHFQQEGFVVLNR